MSEKEGADDFRLLVEGKMTSEEYVRRLRARVAANRELDEIKASSERLKKARERAKTGPRRLYDR